MPPVAGLADDHREATSRELRLRPLPRCAQRPGQERADTRAASRHQLSAAARFRLARLVRSATSMPGDDRRTARPDGIPGSGLSGPWPVGQYADRLRDRLRGFSRVQVFGEVFNLRAGRARVWFELRDARGALPCSMWRRDFDALAVPLADGQRVVAAGGCDYYPGSRAASPSFSFAVDRRARRRRGRPARAARPAAARAPRRGPVRAAEAAGAAGAAALHRRRDGRGRQGARRRARRPAPARLGGAARVGVRARPGPPRRAGRHARAAGPRRLRGGRGRDRRARRRLARRPVRVLRRDAVPDGRAAARPRRSRPSATTPTAR